MRREQEFNDLMLVLTDAEKSRVLWSSYSQDDAKTRILFVVPGQVNEKDMYLPELLEYCLARYGVGESHPKMVNVIQHFNDEIVRLKEKNRLEEEEREARRERYQQLYAPFSGLSREQLMDEIHRLRNGEDGLLFQQALQAKDAEIERLEAEVEKLEQEIRTHDNEVSAVQWKLREAYQFAQQVLADNQALKDELAILRAEIEAQEEVDIYDEHKCSSDENDEDKFPDVDDEEVDTLATTINDQLSQ